MNYLKPLKKLEERIEELQLQYSDYAERAMKLKARNPDDEYDNFDVLVRDIEYTLNEIKEKD